MRTSKKHNSLINEELLSERTASVLKSLAQRAWYIDLDTPFITLNKLHAAIERGDAAFVDGVMSIRIEHFLRDIKKSCEKQFPQRWPILNQAFLAHKRKQYALSIPVFLAQADGISADIFGVKLYVRKKGIPATASKVAEFEKIL